MKRRLVLQAERESRHHAPMTYTVVQPHGLFVRTDLCVVYPDLAARIAADQKRGEDPETPQATVGGSSTEVPDERNDRKDDTSMDVHGADIKARRNTAGPSPSPSPLSVAGEGGPATFRTALGPFCVITFQEGVYVESLIDFNDSAKEFKDMSREHFFAFVDHLRDRIAARCGGALGGPVAEDETRGGLKRIIRGKVGSSGAGIAGPADIAGTSVWLDCTDPATGLPLRSTGSSSIHVETDGIEQLLNMDLVYVCGPGGGCRMVSHPVFGTKVYPATIVVYGLTGDELLLALGDM